RALGVPEGEDPLGWAFGALGVQDRAKYLASLFLDDLADVIREGVDPRFGLSRYGEKLAASAPSFDPMREALDSKSPTLVDQILDEITTELLVKHQPEIVALTVPFPGNLYGALRIARKVKEHLPAAKVLMGGGYVNTELRELSEPRLFDEVDFITLDDGERPLLCLLDYLEGKRSSDQLLRTFLRESGKVVFKSSNKL
ncbi:radical SAM protein, partial [bacterium]|nr:radical SAM protein [bacterium]